MSLLKRVDAAEYDKLQRAEAAQQQAEQEVRATSDQKLAFVKDSLARDTAWKVCVRQQELAKWATKLPEVASKEVSRHVSKAARKFQESTEPPKLASKRKPREPPQQRPVPHANWVTSTGEWSQRPEIVQSEPVSDERGNACERHQHRQQAAATLARGATPGHYPSTRPRLVPHANWVMSVGDWSERPEVLEAPPVPTGGVAPGESVPQAPRALG